MLTNDRSYGRRSHLKPRARLQEAHIHSFLKPAWFRAIPYFGILGPGIVILGMLLSAVTYTGVDGQAYNPLNHSISELGHIGVAQLSAVFNGGLILGSLINMPFMIYVGFRTRSRWRWPLAILGGLSAIFVALIGVFPMNYSLPHFIVAITYFALAITLIFLYSILILTRHGQPYPKWMAVPGVIIALMILWLIVFTPDIIDNPNLQERLGTPLDPRPDVYSLAVIEWILAGLTLPWIILMGIHFSKQQPEPDVDRRRAASQFRDLDQLESTEPRGSGS